MTTLRRLAASVLTLGLLAAAAPSATAQEVKAGTVRIPRDLKLAGVTKGSYTVRIVPGAEGPYFVFASRDGQELLRELAIVQEQKGKVSRPQTAVHMLTKDEQMVRIIVRHGTQRYLAYFETGA